VFDVAGFKEFLNLVSILANAQGDKWYVGAFTNTAPGTKSIACSTKRDGGRLAGV